MEEFDNNKTNLLNNTNSSNIRKLTWIYILFSFFSCLYRNDYNIVCSIILILLLDRFFIENEKFYSKIILQLLCLFLILDVVILFIYIPFAFNNGNKDFDSFFGSRLMAILIGIIIMLIKGIIFFIIFKRKNKENPNKNNIKDLFNFKYE
jgi:NADH:ubiquinone oxidoreductase subunit 2 (subunit N)